MILRQFLFFCGLKYKRHILSLDGPVVTAVGYKDELAVVTHASPPLPSNEQVQFIVTSCD